MQICALTFSCLPLTALYSMHSQGKKKARISSAQKDVSSSLPPLFYETNFFKSFIALFLSVAAEVVERKQSEMESDTTPAQEEITDEDESAVKTIIDNDLLFMERFLEMLIDLVSQLPTRRFLCLLLDSLHLSLRLRRLLPHGGESILGKERGGDGLGLVRSLLDRLVFYERMEVDNFSGAEMDDNDILARHCDRYVRLLRDSNQYPVDACIHSMHPFLFCLFCYVVLKHFLRNDIAHYVPMQYSSPSTNRVSTIST